MWRHFCFERQRPWRRDAAGVFYLGYSGNWGTVLDGPLLRFSLRPSRHSTKSRYALSLSTAPSAFAGLHRTDQPGLGSGGRQWAISSRRMLRVSIMRLAAAMPIKATAANIRNTD
jgi:hypothetical protein